MLSRLEHSKKMHRIEDAWNWYLTVTTNEGKVWLPGQPGVAIFETWNADRLRIE